MSGLTDESYPTLAVCTNPDCPNSGPNGEPYTVTIESDVYGTYAVDDDLKCPVCNKQGEFK